jgi:hypothetical protein
VGVRYDGRKVECKDMGDGYEGNVMKEKVW